MSIEFRDITFVYGRRRTLVLHDFTWCPTGTRTVLLGPNGAGKSTLLKIAAGLHAPRKGTCTLAGLSWARRGDRAEYSRTLGWMPQNIHALSALTTLDQVTYAGWLRGLSTQEARRNAQLTLERVGLTDKMTARASTLSGGQLRRVGLAEALVAAPRYLILDEPTAGLDPSQRTRFHDILNGLDDVHLLISTHDIDDLDTTYDTVAVLAQGTMKFDGPVDEFYAHGASAEKLSDTQRATRAYEHFALDPDA
ncbi:ATP-binding cassette domain-containing protein [Micrococcales bacterium 31B]|nr:ATP-binding cassette domain-containing protein [Micrococcales bacterium 31B]